MSKGQAFLVFIIILVGILVASFLIYSQSPKSESGYRPGLWPEADTAVNQAQFVYKLKKEGNLDLSTGPCLSNDLMPNWVADMVHLPRQPIDDLPENQCSAYLEGRAKHFVELDLDGNLIRVK